MSKSGMTKDLTQGGVPPRASAFFLDERTNALGNEDTFLTLMSMKSFFKDSVASGEEKKENDKAVAVLDEIAKEEARYMVQAAKALHGKPKDESPESGNFIKSQATLRRKFGRDMNAVAELAKVLKSKVEDKETEDILLGMASGLEREGSSLKSGLVGKKGGLSSILA